MAPRATVSDVTNRLDTDLTNAQVAEFLADANVWVDANLVGQGLSAVVLRTVETHLACHLCTLRDPRRTKVSVGDLSETFQRDATVTEYLTAAIALDSTGRVAEAFTGRTGQTLVYWRTGTSFDDAADNEG